MGIGKAAMTVWNDDTVRTLTELIASGKSQREVATELGLSPGAVIGKLWRLRIKSTISANNKDGTITRFRKPRAPAMAKIKRTVKVKREKRLSRLAVKKPGRLCFHLGITGRLL